MKYPLFKNWNKWEIFICIFGIIENCFLVYYFDDISNLVAKYSLSTVVLLIWMMPLFVILIIGFFQMIRDEFRKCRKKDEKEEKKEDKDG